MLRIIGGNYREAQKDKTVISCPDYVFELEWDKEWLNSKLGRRLITEVDKLDVMTSEDVDTALRVQFCILPTQLCTGTKNILCARYFAVEHNRKILLSRMGPNCYRFLMDVANEVDVTAVATNFFPFADSDILERPVEFPELGKICRDARSFAEAMWDIEATGIWDKVVD